MDAIGVPAAKAEVFKAPRVGCQTDLTAARVKKSSRWNFAAEVFNFRDRMYKLLIGCSRDRFRADASAECPCTRDIRVRAGADYGKGQHTLSDRRNRRLRRWDPGDGGLFFNGVPENPQAAFVIVTHLNPERESVLHEVVGRYTELPVLVADDGMQVEKQPHLRHAVQCDPDDQEPCSADAATRRDRTAAQAD
ncbi:chemotaxis protein CheB [Roseibium salinum]|nr:chemotaxis protein CheB [Roseibium salinum]